MKKFVNYFMGQIGYEKKSNNRVINKGQDRLSSVKAVVSPPPFSSPGDGVKKSKNVSPTGATILKPSKSLYKPRAVPPFPVEFSDIERGIFNMIYESGYTMVSAERFYHSLLACKYVIENNIPGDWVECGVWSVEGRNVACG